MPHEYQSLLTIADHERPYSTMNYEPLNSYSPVFTLVHNIVKLFWTKYIGIIHDHDCCDDCDQFPRFTIINWLFLWSTISVNHYYYSLLTIMTAIINHQLTAKKRQWTLVMIHHEHCITIVIIDIIHQPLVPTNYWPSLTIMTLNHH